ncbi:hypothetical protein TNCV_1488291 [Trichonephila clavipes]|nr:hypothetical protein TNCV_1488291 [Trichonephila clavipes]
MDMVDAWSPAEDSDLKVWDLAQSVSLCLNRGASVFILRLFLHQNSRADYLDCPLITSDWSRTNAELPHKVHCLLKRGK